MSIRERAGRGLRSVTTMVALGTAMMAIVAIAPMAWAGDVIVPTAQSRSVGGSAYAEDLGGSDQDSNSDQAPDFLPFSAAESASASVSNAMGTGGGQQDSSIQPASIQADGAAFATAEPFDFDAFADGAGHSRVSIDFTLTVASDFTLAGTIAATDSGSADIIFAGPGGEIYGGFVSGPAEQIFISETGFLPPGDYSFSVNADGGAFGDGFFSDYAFAEFDISLTFTPNEGCIAPPADLVSWWPGDSTAEDIVGRNPAMPRNGAGYAPGLVLDAFSLPADGDFLEMDERPNLVYAGDLTINAWIRFGAGSITTNRTILHRGALDDRTYSFWVDGSAGNALRFAHATSDFVASASLVWNPDTWYHVAAVREGDFVTLYRNGGVVGSGPLAASANETAGFTTQIGATLGSDYFRGSIDELQYLRRALTPDEVSAIHGAVSAGQCKEPIAICGLSAVNVGCGAKEDVLLLNGLDGGALNTVEIGTTTAISLTIGEPSIRQNDGQASNACIYAWVGAPIQHDLRVLPKNLGRMCFGLKVIATQQPAKIWNAIGVEAKLGVDDAPGPPPAIPDGGNFRLLNLAFGYGQPLTVTFQGIVQDECTRATQPYSVTNGIVLEITP